METVLQSITLHDEVLVERSRRPGSIIEWAPGLTGALPGRPDIVETTLALARELVPELPTAEVRVIKRIPPGAGLGGGSADAAAALLGAVALHGRSLPEPVVEEIARKAGVDVPFCLRGGTALGTGLGDEIRALPCARTLWWVIGIPGTPLSTPAVYGRYDRLPAPARGEIEEVVDGLVTGSLGQVAGGMFNHLEPAAFDLLPELAGMKEAMLGAGAIGSVMTGSGSAIIGLCRDSSHARSVAAEARKIFPRVEVSASARAGNEMLSR